MKEEIMKNIGFELKRTRENQGLTIKEVADKTSYSSMLISRYENGKAMLIDNLIDLLDCILKPRNYFIKYNFLISDIIPDKVILKERLDQIEYILITYLNYNFMNKIDKFDEDFYEIIKKIDDKKIIKYLFINNSICVFTSYSTFDCIPTTPVSSSSSSIVGLSWKWI